MIDMGQRTCSVEGCAKPHFGKGFCLPHYHRWKRKGDPGPVEVWDRKPGTCKIEGCDGKRSGAGFCATHYMRFKRTGSPHIVRLVPRDEANWLWKGADLGYRGAHMRTWRMRGDAAAHVCDHCGAQARQWAYDHQDPDELVSTKQPVGLVYSADPWHYIALCGKCHCRFDGRGKS